MSDCSMTLVNYLTTLIYILTHNNIEEICVNLFAFFCLCNVLCRSELYKLDCLLFANVSILSNLSCVKLNLQVLFTLIESLCCLNTLFNISLLVSTKLFIYTQCAQVYVLKLKKKTNHQLFPQYVGTFIQYFSFTEAYAALS